MHVVGEVDLGLFECAWLFFLNPAGLGALENVFLGCRDVVELLRFDAEVLGENGFGGMSWEDGLVCVA
jgi:hypothetical protein